MNIRTGLLRVDSLKEPSPNWKMVKVLRHGDSRSAEVKLVEIGGDRFILKDFCRSSRWFRAIAGTYMAWREMTAYRRLEAVSGVPRLFSRFGIDGLLLEYIDCHPDFVQVQKNFLRPDFYDEIRQILREIRERGVLHGDVCRNVIVNKNGRPYLIDFGASFTVPRWFGPIGTFILRIGGEYDEKMVVEIKHRMTSGLLTSDEQRLLTKRLPFDRVVTLTQQTLQKILLWVFKHEGRTR